VTTRQVVLAAAAAMLAVVSGCERELEPSLRVATFHDNGGDSGNTASIGGIVHGRANDDGTACFWLGTGDFRLALVWPPGAGAERHPLRVIDRFGNMIMKVGQTYSSGGGSMRGAVLGCTGIHERIIR
jgi:hypothetical protein